MTFLRQYLNIYVILAVLLLIVMLFYYNLSWLPNDYDYDFDVMIPNNLTNHKTILYWNDFFGNRNYFGKGSKPFEHCEIDNCYITSNRGLTAIDQFDAIIFHAAEYTNWQHHRPKKRSPKQRYIFFDLETSINREPDRFESSYFYNWTLTYWRKSDLFGPYAKVIKSANDYKLPNEDYVKNKTNMAAWLVSNCNTPSKRQKYAKKLAKHLNIDIYGECGPNKCPKDNLTECYKMLEKNYLFYLSFENTFCEDYITEKLYNLLHYNIVPVVYGYGDYSELAPPNSVINTANFKTIEQLANYLTHLSQNPAEYLKYFEWKKDYIVNTNLKNYVLCDLCKKLHGDDEVKIYKDLNSWWKTNCINQNNIKVPN